MTDEPDYLKILTNLVEDIGSLANKYCDDQCPCGDVDEDTCDECHIQSIKSALERAEIF